MSKLAKKNLYHTIKWQFGICRQNGDGILYATSLKGLTDRQRFEKGSDR